MILTSGMDPDNTIMPIFSLFSSFRTSFMKSIFTSFFAFCACLLTWSQGEVGTSPLEYNTDKYYQFHTSSIYNQSKSLYPACGTKYYFYDTLSLPFIDDFSRHHFTTYHDWDWPTEVDSIAHIFKLTPDTFAIDTALHLFNYSLTPTRHYSYLSDTVNNIDSHIVNIPRQLILFGNCQNPFIATDTITVYAITSPRYYWDTLSLHVLSQVIFPDSTLSDDTTQTIQVFYPPLNNNYWIDNYAYRNVSMGVNPPTYGVVTFDGTNEFGEPYSPGGNNSYGVADYLTSKPIDLSYTPADGVVLSFFSQPTGLGYRPDAHDSLVVEFYSPVTEKWYHQWSSIGDTLSGDTSRAFLQTAIAITNSLFLQNGFQFRFKNWGNLSGNLDHWNIDYVRLDTNRTVGDTLIDDVAFVFLPPSILHKYTAMPYEQFTLADKNNKWNNYISNLFNATKQMSYKYDFRNEAGTLLNQYPYPSTPGLDTFNILPFHPNGYSNYQRWSEPDFDYDFSGAPALPFTDTARFTISHYLKRVTTDVNHENDSITLKQDFINYYSYDDGTAEQTIWLGTPGYMVSKFTLNFADTLRALQFYFSPIKDDITSHYITLQVYKGDLNTLVYQTSRQVGVNEQDSLSTINPINNGFTTYLFHDTIIPLPAGDFFVGWYQNQTFKLNVGFDRNLDNSSRTYFRTSANWDTLSLPGTVMMRPMVGHPLVKDQIGIENYRADAAIQLYPNPASETVYFSVGEHIHLTGIRIVDITGKLVYNTTNISSNQVDVSGFAQGLYFMQFIADQSPQPVTKKFIIAR